mmetsp:Transcript_127704/g.361433  ORF Transcript_127704/g.361433 Transcript_127704/m.361433 type:complete len:345 (-) Transcript_127704:53-1087(-)
MPPVRPPGAGFPRGRLHLPPRVGHRRGEDQANAEGVRPARRGRGIRHPHGPGRLPGPVAGGRPVRQVRVLRPAAPRRRGAAVVEGRLGLRHLGGCPGGPQAPRGVQGVALRHLDGRAGAGPGHHARRGERRLPHHVPARHRRGHRRVRRRRPCAPRRRPRRLAVHTAGQRHAGGGTWRELVQGDLPRGVAAPIQDLQVAGHGHRGAEHVHGQPPLPRPAAPDDPRSPGGHGGRLHGHALRIGLLAVLLAERHRRPLGQRHHIHDAGEERRRRRWPPSLAGVSRARTPRIRPARLGMLRVFAIHPLRLETAVAEWRFEAAAVPSACALAPKLLLWEGESAIRSSI